MFYERTQDQRFGKGAAIFYQGAPGSNWFGTDCQHWTLGELQEYVSGGDVRRSLALAGQCRNASRDC